MAQWLRGYILQEPKDDYKIYFPLLKSRDRLISHDQIWEKICEYLKWEFIRSV